MVAVQDFSALSKDHQKLIFLNNFFQLESKEQR